jgi:BolA-like protein 1
MITCITMAFGLKCLNQRVRIVTSACMMSSSMNVEELDLTPLLTKYVNALRSVKDDKLRYQQLLYLAAKCEGMPDTLKVEGNKVPGCLSTVHVHATLEDDKIMYQGDSDSQLTKGLVAMLVNGLTGCTADEIERIQPEFIRYAGIGASLTPGRNNGFLNMLNVMKVKARQLTDGNHNNCSGSTQTKEAYQVQGSPIYQAMVSKLSQLQPLVLDIEDESYKHASHAGTQGLASSETHFNVRIVADAFEGKSLVQRHKMIYSLLAVEMNSSIHALSINAKTPSE